MGQCDDFIGEGERCAAEDCTSRDPSECGAYCSTLSADPVGLNPATEHTALGCDAGELSCGEAETCALDEDGACWRFSTTCIPEGFEDLNCSAADLGGDAEDIIADYVTVEVPDAVEFTVLRAGLETVADELVIDLLLTPA